VERAVDQRHSARIKSSDEGCFGKVFSSLVD
jgi:hypothetical protein